MKNYKRLLMLDINKIKGWMDETGYGTLRENTGAYTRVRHAFQHLDQCPY